jgi:6-phosphogluconate dehydrogenase
VSDGFQSDVGIIGLDVIGRNAALRLSDHGFDVIAMDWGKPTAHTLFEAATGTRARVTGNISELKENLRHPRTILVFGSGDSSLNLIMEELLPELAEGDLVIDAGHSFFKETARHSRLFAERRIHFLAVGFAGGEREARHGAVLMAGGTGEAVQRARPVLEALAKTARGEACVHYFETAAAAQFVKMAHGGVDGALLHLLAESFALLQHSLVLTDEELHDSSSSWHIGVLNGYLMEISGSVIEQTEQQTSGRWLEQQLESSKNEMLCNWAAQTAWDLEVAVPTIEAAAGLQRPAAPGNQESLQAATFRQPVGQFGDDPESVLEEIHEAFQAAMLITYAQAMAMLAAAANNVGFQFRLHDISRAWRGCARLRAPLLDDITIALQAMPDLPDLLSDDDLSEQVMARQEKLRHAVWRAYELDLPVPALLASLDYLDSNRAAWLPVNLVQVSCQQSARAAVQMGRVF